MLSKFLIIINEADTDAISSLCLNHFECQLPMTGCSYFLRFDCYRSRLPDCAAGGLPMTD
jgi:hypothetical protein